MTRPTEAEQNRLIQSHIAMVAPIAAQYRGRKGIPFEELVSEGVAGLVGAARMWEPVAEFSTYATIRIRGAIQNFIESWQEFVPIDEQLEDEDRVHWWQIWSDIPYEGWTTLPATPQEMIETFEEFSEKHQAAEAAFLSLNKREKQMVRARFFRQPHSTLDQIARDHKLSYIRTVEIISRAIKKMRDIVVTIESRRLAA